MSSQKPSPGDDRVVKQSRNLAQVITKSTHAGLAYPLALAKTRTPQNMAALDEEVRRLEARVKWLEAKISIYESHHTECNVISPESRTSVDYGLSETAHYYAPESSSPTYHQGQHERQETSSPSGGLEIVPYDISSAKAKSKAKKRTRAKNQNVPNKKVKWVVAADTFVRDLPTEEEWSSFLANSSPILLVSSPVPSCRTSLIDAESPTLSTVERLLPVLEQTQVPALKERALYLARQTSSFIAKASEANARARVQLLAFLSYCSVLERLELLTREDIDTITSEVIGSDTSSTRSKRIRDGAVWMNSVAIMGLIKEGWKLGPATLLISLCAPYRPYLYAEIRNQEIWDSILQKVQEAYSTSGPIQDIEFSIPKCIVGWHPTFSLDNVCKALGYSTVALNQLGCLQERIANGSDQCAPSSGSSCNGDIEANATSFQEMTALSEHCLQRVNQREPTWAIESEPSETTRSLDGTAYLFLLADSLGSPLPEPLFQRTTRLRWNEDGEEERSTLSEAGLDGQLVSILSSEDNLQNALSLFQCSSGKFQHWAVPSHTAVPIVSGQQRLDICFTAVKWVCFAFPRIVDLEPQYKSLVESLFPLLDHVLASLNGVNISTPVKHEIAEALIAACKVDSVRQDALSNVATFLDEESPLYLRAGLALSKSIWLRLSGDYVNSEYTIHDFYCQCGSPNDECFPRAFRGLPSETNGRLRAHHGLLHRSHMENLVQCERYCLASSQILDWKMPKSASAMEQNTLASIILTSCKVHRSQGGFETIRLLLERSLRSLRGSESIYYQIYCQLLDAYMDLKLPQHFESLIRSRKWGLLCKDSSAYRRVLVSSLDADLQKERFDDANNNIKILCQTFQALQPLNVSDQLLHMRVLIVSARIRQLCSEFDQAISEWNDALEHVQKYSSFSGEGFTYAAIHLSISLAYLMLGKKEDARESFVCGQSILRQGKRDYWIPTLPAWVHDVTVKIQELTGWDCHF